MTINISTRTVETHMFQNRFLKEPNLKLAGHNLFSRFIFWDTLENDSVWETLLYSTFWYWCI